MHETHPLLKRNTASAEPCRPLSDHDGVEAERSRFNFGHCVICTTRRDTATATPYFDRHS
eukprot:m.392622 g.392622  ORF g.392622 m.392622 type:complete len:60 (-) comp28325_c0_seq16:3130-3309(-)